MAKTNAERQAAYRARRIGETRLNLWIADSAALALERLAEHGGTTKRATLERLLIDAGEALDANLGGRAQ